MNRKIMGALAALLLLGSASVFANAAIGVQGGYTVSNEIGGGNIAVTFKLSEFPMVFAADMAIHKDFFSAGLSADYWLCNPSFNGAVLRWYTGPGVDTSFVTAGSYTGVYIAGRWVWGINAFVLTPLELYLQIAGELGLGIASTGVDFPEWRVPINFGFRFWF